MLLSALLLSTACVPEPLVRTEIREVPVAVYVALDPELTADCPIPQPPAGNCRWKGHPVLCNGQLVDYSDALVAAIEACNGDKGEIRNLQPENP